LAEGRLQAIDDLRFKAPLGNGRFLSQPTMEFFGQPKADHPTPRAFHQDKASDGCSKHQANDQSGNGSKRDGHGDTPPIIRPYLQSRGMSDTDLGSRIDACHGADGFRLPSSANKSGRHHID
jgi:hypothetical protein